MTATCVEPLPAMEAGLKLQLLSAGRPAQDVAAKLMRPVEVVERSDRQLERHRSAGNGRGELRRVQRQAEIRLQVDRAGGGTGGGIVGVAVVGCGDGVLAVRELRVGETGGGLRSSGLRVGEAIDWKRCRVDCLPQRK